MENSLKAVVFDMDGVIFDSETGVKKCWEELSLKYGFSNVDEVFFKCLGTNKAGTKQIFLDCYGEDFPYETYEKEASLLFHEKYDYGKLPLKPYVTKLLTYLKKENVKIGLATSSRQKTVLNELNWAGLLSFFDEIVCGDMIVNSKPAPDIYLLACEKLSIDPKDAYAIEDSYNGIRSAYAAGLKTIMVPDLMPVTKEIKELCVGVFDDLKMVLSFFEKEKGKKDA